MAPTVLDVLNESIRRLDAVDSPRLSAELLMTEVLGCRRLDLVLDRDRRLNLDEVEAVRGLVRRRAKGEPVAYILGRKEFYGLDFRVNASTLIPRPETEHIVEWVQERFDDAAAFRFADLGTGSGILAVTICRLFPQARCVAVDISAEALDAARRNAEDHAVLDRTLFAVGDFRTPLLAQDSCHLIVANPPYVPNAEYRAASREVTAYEPRSALVSGDDGLDHYRAMIPHVHAALKRGGVALVELGFQHAYSAKKITSAKKLDFAASNVIKDLSGHDRVIVLHK